MYSTTTDSQMAEEGFAGLASGCVQTVFGHPLDTLKVAMQSNSKSVTKRQLSLRALYQGFWYPFASNGAFTAIQFSCDSYFCKHFNFTNHFLSGAMSGAIGSVVITPVDLYKVRAQQSVRWSFVWPYRGIVPSLMREVPATSMYFGLYHWLQSNRSHNPLLHGGLSGVACWLVSYPLDTIKTRIQSGECDSIKSALTKKYLWRGIVPCLIRSFIVNACGFFVYEWLTKK